MTVDLAVVVLAWIGTIFVVVAAVGIVRMPDLFSRLQVSSKVPALSVALLVISLALRFDDTGVAIRAVALMLLVFVTSPLAAHLIARAGFVTRVELEPGTRVERRPGDE